MNRSASGLSFEFASIGGTYLQGTPSSIGFEDELVSVDAFITY